ncbi:chemotaxis protein CheA [Pseudogemmobacter blasticus]|uniref:Chemotaxis protein CheA n=1 Tax=Fuscovulum blasticum DSM 2131 TaxID=1188250 RepID=A0A2T4J5E0_FUSBL|nr:chemotaxis protein CheA [Fuscovulum blasticum]PTE13058.1 chemotaxis protein CheA [Fuscovulum blasticum DSM 2131]
MTARNAIRDTFFEECEELLEALVEGLAQMAVGAGDGETLNAVFRAVHSVKGGAGAFALEALVGFAHRFETVLDGIRAGRIALTPEVMHTLLRSADHLAEQVEAARDDRAIAPEVTAGFLANLYAILGEDAPEEPDGAGDDPCFGFAAVALDLGPLGAGAGLGADGAGFGVGSSVGPGAEVIGFPGPGPREAAPGWRVRFRPLPALYAHGHDPAALFAALADLGPVTVTLDLSDLPPWEGFDPAGAWLAWTIRLAGAVPEAAVREVFDFVQGLCLLDIAPDDPPAGPPAEPAAAPPLAPPPRREARAPEDDPAAGPKPTLRVDLDRVDRLINAVGELIINQAMIEQSVLDLTLSSEAEVIGHVEGYRLLARDLQEAVMAIRAQPVKPLFQRMSRILREAAEATGKQARLVTLGEATEVDKTVIERLADPLTHMIRNAVDHGLEPPAARLAAGKPAEGTLRLSAAHRSGSVILSLRDDGAGLDRARIRAKALARGLISPEADLTEAEIDNLLFLPGFSTAEKVSNLSGRGVGLDVVKNAVTALGGRVAIASVPGEGTEFTISLPLTLAVMDGMVISVAGRTMVIPVASVIETLRPDPADLHGLGPQDRVLSIRGRFLPVIDVAQGLGLPARRNAAQDGAEGPPLLLLVETESQSHCALVVDEVHDQRQVVIKGLEANYGAIPGVAAATVLGDGRIALILDAEALTAQRPPADPAARPPFPNAGVSHASP